MADNGTSTSVIYLVSEVRRNNSKPLEAFESKKEAKTFLEEHTTDFDELDEKDWADYHVGMGGKAKFSIQGVPLNRSSDTGTDQ